jgi:alpha-tubulin suppressor-like RCC1 family protein
MVSGATRCWGANTDGQLGTGTLTASHFAVAVSSLDGVHAKATAITVGGAHTCARLTDGSLRCWGRNSSGQLGDGTLTRRLVPAKVRASAASFLTGVSFVTAGEAHTCAFLGTGSAVRVRCWGANASGQLGMNTTTPSRYAVAVSGVLTNGALSLSCGGLHTVALVRGTARPPALGAAWGSNSSGQLGNGTTAPARLPTVIARL